MAKILVIDDDDNLRELVRANLAIRKYRVFLAPGGEIGLQGAQDEQPDLILLDLMMPGMSGWEVLTVLKANDKLKKIPVVIMTAAIQPSQHEKAYALGAISYLAKPFDIEELLRQVAGAIGQDAQV